jgi:hypothetical protein
LPGRREADAKYRNKTLILSATVAGFGPTQFDPLPGKIVLKTMGAVTIVCDTTKPDHLAAKLQIGDAVTLVGFFYNVFRQRDSVLQLRGSHRSNAWCPGIPHDPDDLKWGGAC